MSTHPVYCGELVCAGWLQRFYATSEGVEVRTLYGTPSPFSSVVIWREHEAVRVTLSESQLLAELERHADQADTLLVLGRTIAAVRRLRREARDVVLAPSEWTVIAMAEASV